MYIKNRVKKSHWGACLLQVPLPSPSIPQWVFVAIGGIDICSQFESNKCDGGDGLVVCGRAVVHGCW